jgi:hypothetical protein
MMGRRVFCKVDPDFCVSRNPAKLSPANLDARCPPARGKASRHDVTDQLIAQLLYLSARAL